MSECRPVVDAASCLVPGCHYDDADGRRAWEGRARIVADLQTPSGPGVCDCRKCRARAAAFSDDDAAGVMRHVTDRMAVLYLLGKATMGGMIRCEDCEGWIPSFSAPITEPDLNLQRGCPFHPL